MWLDFRALSSGERRVALLVASEALARIERVRDIRRLGPEFELALDMAYGMAAETLMDLVGEVERSYPEAP